jgi:hypothetical protein
MYIFSVHRKRVYRKMDVLTLFIACVSTVLKTGVNFQVKGGGAVANMPLETSTSALWWLLTGYEVSVKRSSPTGPD